MHTHFINRFLILILCGIIITTPLQAAYMGLVDYSSSEDDESDSDSEEEIENPTPLIENPATVKIQVTPPRRESKISAKSPLAGTPRRNLALKNKITPERRLIEASLTKQPRETRVRITQTAATALLDSVRARRKNINAKIKQQGVLLINNRVIEKLSEELISDVATARSKKSYNASMLNKDRLIHALSMEMIVHAILYGKCFMQRDNTSNKELLVIIAPVVCTSNDDIIDEWISDHSEIKLTFGYPPESTSDSNDPFVLYHAMMHNPFVGKKYHEKAVDKVDAFLAETEYSDEPILHFRIHPAKNIQLISADDLFKNTKTRFN